MNQVFSAITSRQIADSIRQAQQRVLLCVPSVREAVAVALRRAAERLRPGNVRVVLDCDDEVFRLGYGEVSAVRTLHEAGIDVRHCPGLRIGLVVVDDRGWSFTPTALYVQPEVHSDETPNAIELASPSIEAVVAAAWPSQSAEAICSEVAEGLPEIGVSALENGTLERVERSLETAPPMPFDVARQVRVFQPYIQYVEISLRGCAIQRHRVTIPKDIQGLGVAKEIENRLRTTFELIEQSSDLSSKALEDELRSIRDNLTPSLGKPWGRVVLRSVRPLLDERLNGFREKLAEHKRKVEEELGKRLNESRQQVADYYTPLVKRNPPDCLAGRIIGPPTEEVIQDWLHMELDRTFPNPKDLLSDMALDVQYRDVTYETLNEDGFADALKAAFPHVDWDRPFEEFNAAKERGRESAL